MPYSASRRSIARPVATFAERHDDLVVALARRVSASLKEVLVRGPNGPLPAADIVRDAIERAVRGFLDDRPLRGGMSARHVAGELDPPLRIPPAHRNAETRVVQARALLRSGEPRRAQAALGPSWAGLGPDALVTWMEVALATGRVADATAAVEALDPDRLPRRAYRCMALVLAHAGRGEQALALIDRALIEAESAADAVDPALLATCRAHCLWIGGRSVEAARCLADARPAVDGDAASQSVWPPALFSLILAELGEIAEAERLLETAERIAARRADGRHQIELGACRAFVQFERGDRSEAIEGLRAAATALERVGHLLAALWYKVWLAGWLVQVGRRREGRQLLTDVVANAQASGIASLVDAAQRNAERDPVAELAVDSRPPPRDKQGERARASALAALRAAARGHAEEMVLRLGEVDALSSRPGYGLDRVIAHLARAIILRMHSRSDAAAAELGELVKIAAAECVDADLLTELVARLGDVLVVTGRCQRQLAPEAAVDLAPYTVVIDARTHELRIGDETRSLRRRVVVRRLLYSLASHPGRIVPKAELVEAAWARPYDPLQHDDPIKSNILHLRRALDGTGIEIEFDDTGYCLHAPGRFAFAAPFVLWTDPI